MRFEQWLTTCPICGAVGKLYVISAWVYSFAKVVKMHVKLCPDGFEVPMNSKDPQGNYSTDQEKVRCDVCRTVFDLSDLDLDNQGGVEAVAKCSWNELPLLIGTVGGPAAKLLERRLKDYVVYDSIRKADGRQGGGLLRKLMDKDEIKIADRLVRLGYLFKGTSDDKQGTVVYHVR